MLLKTLLQNNPNINVKVGAKANFFYCGENNESATTHLQEYLDREVIYCINGVSPDEPNTMVIKVQGEENGKFWTIKEYKKHTLYNQIRYLQTKIREFRLKFKKTNNVEFKNKIKNTKNEIKNLTLTMNQL